MTVTAVAEDPGRERFAPRFGRGGLPQVYLADRDGTVRFAHVGPLDLSSEEMKARINAVLPRTGVDW